MKVENRVIHRIGARELTPEEIEKIKGGVLTISTCTALTMHGFGGDDGPGHDGC